MLMSPRARPAEPLNTLLLVIAALSTACIGVPKSKPDAGDDPGPDGDSDSDTDGTDPALTELQLQLPEGEPVEACWANALSGWSNDRVVDVATYPDGSSVAALASGTMFAHDADGVLSQTIAPVFDNTELGAPIHAIEPAADGGFVVAGEFSGTAVFGQGEAGETTLVGTGARNLFAARYDENYDLVWARSNTGTGGITVQGLAELADGSHLVVGTVYGEAILGTDEPNETAILSVDTEELSGTSMYLARYLDDGSLSWARTECVGGAGREPAALPDGTFVVSGEYLLTATLGQGQENETTLSWSEPEGASMPDPDPIGAFVAKYDTDGVLQWASGADATWFGFAAPTETAVMADGSVVVTGLFYDALQFDDNIVIYADSDSWDGGGTLRPAMFVSRFDAGGDVLWALSGTCVTDEECLSSGSDAAILADDRIMVAGAMNGAVRFGEGALEDAVIDNQGLYSAVYGADGDLEQLTRIGDHWDAYIGRPQSLTALADGTVIVGGAFEGSAEIDGPDDTVITLTAENERDGFLIRVCP